MKKIIFFALKIAIVFIAAFFAPFLCVYLYHLMGCIDYFFVVKQKWFLEADIIFVAFSVLSFIYWSFV